LLILYAAGCAVIGLVLEGIPEYLSLLVYFLLFCGHCVFVLRTDTAGARKESSKV